MADILSKFGVPVGGPQLGILQPKLKYKFRVLFFGMGFGADSRVVSSNVMTVTRPKVTYIDTQVHSYNSVAYVQGKHEWEPVEITLRDDLTTGTAKVLGEQIQKQMNHFEQTSASSGLDYKFTTEIHTLDGNNPSEVEKWVLDGCFLTAYSSPGGDYSSSDLSEISITIRYDVATHIAGGAGYANGDPMPNAGPGFGGTTVA